MFRGFKIMNEELKQTDVWALDQAGFAVLAFALFEDLNRPRRKLGIRRSLLDARKSVHP